eukprot:CAMPEP_0205827222 /NCGR_PEP_ID=MMETSP0206-20130828/31278_1 /ASSEMBLY_ACC=CAM_ASM_000279 /TAXON_ID=36767 /ORGANISM="Euplotes focardii, Strain TN1" /LENGTH=178 /DNA_ID=CAMNT_0053127915 /DNA_START=137 /DNA_END=669 /DNA_ORIENTATION=+
MTPLSYDLLEYCSSFASEQCPEGIVCISGNTLRIVILEKLGELFNQTVLPLRYTPRKLISNPMNKHLIVIESDHNAYPHKIKLELLKTLAIDDDDEDEGDEEMKLAKKEMEDDDEEKDEGPQESFIGAPQAGNGKWASCIRIVDPVALETTHLLELEDNEAAFSMCIVEFKIKADAGP